jgi:carboxymethylenebutenolidase
MYRHYEQHFMGKWPADTTVFRISRTVGEDQVVDELILSFTHDVSLAFMLALRSTNRQTC